MTKILEQAIAKARTLSEEDQDALGAVWLALAEDWPTGADDLDDETLEAIHEGIDQAKRGDLASDEEMQALRKRFGL